LEVAERSEPVAAKEHARSSSSSRSRSLYSAREWGTGMNGGAATLTVLQLTSLVQPPRRPSFVPAARSLRRRAQGRSRPARRAAVGLVLNAPSTTASSIRLDEHACPHRRPSIGMAGTPSISVIVLTDGSWRSRSP
jgi:hypothetical protein